MNLFGIEVNFNSKQIISSFMILFAVIDIIGSIPVIIDLRRKIGYIQSKKATSAALIIMILFLFLGEKLLNLLAVDVSSFAIAGSFILFFLALEMILGIRIYKDETPQTASVIPLAFPILAGAGTLTTLLSLRAIYMVENIIVGIILNVILIYVVLKNSNKIERVLGNGGISILRKIFGVILLAISIKLFKTNAL